MNIFIVVCVQFVGYVFRGMNGGGNDVCSPFNVAFDFDLCFCITVDKLVKNFKFLHICCFHSHQFTVQSVNMITEIVLDIMLCLKKEKLKKEMKQKKRGQIKDKTIENKTTNLKKRLKSKTEMTATVLAFKKTNQNTQEVKMKAI